MPTGIVAMDLFGSVARSVLGPPYVRRLVPGPYQSAAMSALAKQKSAMAVQPRRFPVPTKEFRALAKKFPVPMRREFGCKPLNLPVESMPESQNWARIREIAC